MDHAHSKGKHVLAGGTLRLSAAVARAAAFMMALGISLVVAAPLAWANDSAVQPASGTSKIAILCTNDVHCSVDGGDSSIGYAGVAAAVSQARIDFGANNVTLVDAGDAIQGTALGTLSKGGYLKDIMNEVGYDIAVPGNHEFDYGIARLQELVGSSKATYLSCNFDDLSTSSTVFSPYKIVEYGTVKVAYVGVSTPETLTKSSPTNFKKSDGTFAYGFCEDATGAALYSRVQSTVNKARVEGAAYVVLVAHLGQDGVDGRWTSTAVVSHTTGVDVLIDGHSHETYMQDVLNAEGDSVKVLQTGTQLAAYGQIVIDPQAAAGTPVVTASLVQPPVNQDSEVASYVAGIEKNLDSTLNQVVGSSEVLLKAVDYDPSGNWLAWAVRLRETNLGDLVADSYRAALDADIGFVNGGGVRADIAAGEITYGDLLAAQPYANVLCKVATSGQSLLDALEVSARSYPQSNGGFLQTSGLTYEIRTDIPSSVVLDDANRFVGVAGERRVQNVKIKGVAIDPGKNYTVASVPFILIDGGDGYTMFEDAEVLSAPSCLDSDAVIAYIKNNLHSVVGAAYADENGTGRIVFKTAADPTPLPIVPDPDASEDLSSPTGSSAAQLVATGDRDGASAATAAALAAFASLVVSGAALKRSTRVQDRRACSFGVDNPTFDLASAGSQKKVKIGACRMD